jgi:hypothetical protein
MLPPGFAASASPGAFPELRPEDGYQVEAVRRDFQAKYTYDLDPTRLGEHVVVVVVCDVM